MKNYLVSLLTLTTILGGSISPALADDGNRFSDFFRRFRAERQDDRDEDRERQRDERQDSRDELVSKSQELRLKLQQKRNEELTERLVKFWGNAAKRLGRLVAREEAMAVKIEARLRKFEGAGKNVDEQTRLLGDANDDITAAGDALGAAVEELERMKADGATIADMIPKAREHHRTVVGLIRIAHRSLIEVIVSTRGMSMAPTPSVSAAPSATVNP